MVSKVVGLTGGIGSGKTSVANLFAERGVAVVDTDVIAHALTGPHGAAMPAIMSAFGNAMRNADGSMNRAGMRELVFADAAAKSRLESILHPLIHAESVRLLAEAEAPYALLVVPLLFEHPEYRPLLSRTLVVDCLESVQLERVRKRNGLPDEQIKAIIASQMPRLRRLALADDVIENNAGLEALVLQVEQKHQYYLANLANGQ